jgi:hypothetical protein
MTLAEDKLDSPAPRARPPRARRAYRSGCGHSSDRAAYSERAQNAALMTTFEFAAVQFVDLAGYRMAYREWGTTTDRRPVLLVHGIKSSSLSWVRVAPRLAERTRVIAVDLKGHGDSDQPASGYCIGITPHRRLTP